MTHSTDMVCTNPTGPTPKGLKTRAKGREAPPEQVLPTPKGLNIKAQGREAHPGDATPTNHLSTLKGLKHRHSRRFCNPFRVETYIFLVPFSQGTLRDPGLCSSQPFRLRKLWKSR